MKANIVLASGSPRRRALLSEMGRAFTVVEPQVDESVRQGADPAAEAMRLAVDKAEEVAARVGPALIVAADTLVALGGEILGKPRDREHAAGILHRLSGTRHQVITGFCVLDTRAGRRVVDYVSTSVTMKPMSESAIREYVDSGEADGKSGAYAIQETGDRYVSRVEGSFSNVVGLPTERLAAVLGELLPGGDG